MFSQNCLWSFSELSVSLIWNHWPLWHFFYRHLFICYASTWLRGPHVNRTFDTESHLDANMFKKMLPAQTQAGYQMIQTAVCHVEDRLPSRVDKRFSLNIHTGAAYSHCLSSTGSLQDKSCQLSYLYYVLQCFAKFRCYKSITFLNFTLFQ